MFDLCLHVSSSYWVQNEPDTCIVSYQLEPLSFIVCLLSGSNLRKFCNSNPVRYSIDVEVQRNTDGGTPSTCTISMMCAITGDFISATVAEWLTCWPCSPRVVSSI